MVALMKITRAHVLAALDEIENFSPAPAILANAYRLLRDPRSDIESIASLVARDSALSADFIRCANSAYYGRGGSRSIEEAVHKLGLRQTLRLLNLAVARLISSRGLGCYGIRGDDYWAECLFNGLFLEALARETGAAEPDEAYAVGLLRFIGRLGVNRVVEKLQPGARWDRREPIAQWELDSAGLVQAEAGALLLGKWGFSAEMVWAIARQDSPATSANPLWLAEALTIATTLLPQGIGAPLARAVGSARATPPPEIDFSDGQKLCAGTVEKLLHDTSEAFDRVLANVGG
jgi:HD-like signal output (HDOD) protein